MKSHVLIFVCLLKTVFGGNVLFINGVPSPSHHIYNRAIVLGLAEKGHNVTFLSTDLVKKETKNVHYIHLEKAYDSPMAGDGEMNILDFADQTNEQFLIMTPFFYMMVCDLLLESNGLDSLLNYPKDFKFDVVIFDMTFGPCLLPLLERFNNPPLISVSAFANPPYTTDYVGGHKFPAYIPHFAVTYSTVMTFTQRFYNTFLYILDWA